VIDWACAAIAPANTIAPTTMDVIDGFISGLSFPPLFGNVELNLASARASCDAHRMSAAVARSREAYAQMGNTLPAAGDGWPLIPGHSSRRRPIAPPNGTKAGRRHCKRGTSLVTSTVAPTHAPADCPSIASFRARLAK
jgi:hypothetical protein